MTLEIITQDHIARSSDAPLAIEQGGKTFRREKTLDPSCLEVTYFDESHQCHLPIFAASSVKVGDGCQLTERLDPTTSKRTVNSPNGRLASYLAPEAFKSAHEKAKPRLTDKGIFGYTYLGVSLILGTILATWKPFDTEIPFGTADTAEIIATWIMLACLATILLMGFGVLIQESVETAIYSWLCPKTPENYRRQCTTYSKTFTALLPGNIPQKVRTTILKALNRYKDVHLVWEAKEQWASEGIQPEKLPNLDPLVFGETQDGEFILLAKFDLTPLEETIESKFMH